VVAWWALQALPYALVMGLGAGGLVRLRDSGSLGPAAAAAVDQLFFSARFASWWFGLGVMQTVRVHQRGAIDWVE